MKDLNLNTDIKSLPYMECEDEECKGTIFMPAYKFKRLSALLSPSAKEELIPVQIFVCTSCGSIPSQFDI